MYKKGRPKCTKRFLENECSRGCATIVKFSRSRNDSSFGLGLRNYTYCYAILFNEFFFFMFVLTDQLRFQCIPKYAWSIDDFNRCNRSLFPLFELWNLRVASSSSFYLWCLFLWRALFASMYVMQQHCEWNTIEYLFRSSKFDSKIRSDEISFR